MITHSKKFALFTTILAIFFLTGCELAPPKDPEVTLTEASLKVVTALKNKDGAALAKLSNSVTGVRFSPYAHVDVSKDVVIPVDALANIFADPTTQTWGTAAGSGEDIVLTFADYYTKFIYDHDFATAPATGINNTIGKSTMVNNTAEVYPGAQFVEYHFSGFDPKYEGMDWVSLRLVYDKDLKLIGVVHDQWTT